MSRMSDQERESGLVVALRARMDAAALAMQGTMTPPAIRANLLRRFGPAMADLDMHSNKEVEGAMVRAIHAYWEKI